MKQIFDKLFEEIKHGDEEHQRWLREKIDAFSKTQSLIEVTVKSDDDGHEYVIPAHLEAKFDELLEGVDSDFDDEDSDNDPAEEDFFEDMFSQYRTGGSVDSFVTLYAENRYWVSKE